MIKKIKDYYFGKRNRFILIKWSTPPLTMESAELTAFLNRVNETMDDVDFSSVSINETNILLTFNCNKKSLDKIKKALFLLFNGRFSILK